MQIYKEVEDIMLLVFGSREKMRGHKHLDTLPSIYYAAYLWHPSRNYTVTASLCKPT
jgi:hypothetical protein